MILRCRGCNCSDLKSVVSLGFTPLANALLREDQLKDPEEKYPLDLVFCPECTLVQIVETVPPEKLFSEYFYVSSISQTTLKNAKDIAERMIEKKKLDGLSNVLEIGSNDGYLLKNYVEKGIRVIGIEPAANIARVAMENGVRTIVGFFGLEPAKSLAGGADSKKPYSYSADVIHANNVLAHVADLHGILAGFRLLLNEDGVCVIETHYVKDMIDSTQFDCVYHEHLCYYSATSLSNLFKIYGMQLVDVERTDMHGGTLRAFFQREDGPKSLWEDGRERVKDFMDAEAKWVGRLNYYRELDSDIIKMKHKLVDLLKVLKSEKKTISAYGASAKSTTLLNYFGIGSDLLDYVVDGTPIKQGKFTPGTHLPILSPAQSKLTPPDYFLLLTWNFAKEIMEKENEYRRNGGKFIVPIPKIEVV